MHMLTLVRYSFACLRCDGFAPRHRCSSSMPACRCYPPARRRCPCLHIAVARPRAATRTPPQLHAACRCGSRQHGRGPSRCTLLPRLHAAPPRPLAPHDAAAAPHAVGEGMRGRERYKGGRRERGGTTGWGKGGARRCEVAGENQQPRLSLTLPVQ